MVAKFAGTYAGSEQRHCSGEHADDNVSDIQLSGQGGAVFLLPNGKGFALKKTRG